LPADELNVAGALARLATLLVTGGKFGEAEPVARECLTIREQRIPDDWLTFNARGVLGGCLLGMNRYIEAEPLLLSAPGRASCEP
jgi:eukaryotic-like serine/threonine-protein kinase